MWLAISNPEFLGLDWGGGLPEVFRPAGCFARFNGIKPPFMGVQGEDTV